MQAIVKPEMAGHSRLEEKSSPQKRTIDFYQEVHDFLAHQLTLCCLPPFLPSSPPPFLPPFPFLSLPPPLLALSLSLSLSASRFCLSHRPCSATPSTTSSSSTSLLSSTPLSPLPPTTAPPSRSTRARPSSSWRDPSSAPEPSLRCTDNGVRRLTLCTA
jgi:hypothetical protein